MIRYGAGFEDQLLWSEFHRSALMMVLERSQKTLRSWWCCPRKDHRMDKWVAREKMHQFQESKLYAPKNCETQTSFGGGASPEWITDNRGSNKVREEAQVSRESRIKVKVSITSPVCRFWQVEGMIDTSEYVIDCCRNWISRTGSWLLNSKIFNTRKDQRNRAYHNSLREFSFLAGPSTTTG